MDHHRTRPNDWGSPLPGTAVRGFGTGSNTGRILELRSLKIKIHPKGAVLIKPTRGWKTCMEGFVQRGFQSLAPRLALVALVLIAFAVAAVVAFTGGGRSGHAHRGPSASATQPLVVLSEPLPAAPGALAARINLAQTVIDDRSSAAELLARAGPLEQLATLDLRRQTAATRRATLAELGVQAAASMRADLDASAALSALTAPQSHLPRWRIIQPPAPNTLLGYFRAAGARFSVPWEDLAAIELIETDFGRTAGLSPAGAQGPMQFIPAAWAQYGSGQISDQQDAIIAAARLLAANGAPADMGSALYRYNNSADYVRAVEDYAKRMRADARSYYGYYYWQVLYDRRSGLVVLPVGYPKSSPQAIAPGGQG